MPSHSEIRASSCAGCHHPYCMSTLTSKQPLILIYWQRGSGVGCVLRHRLLGAVSSLEGRRLSLGSGSASDPDSGKPVGEGGMLLSGHRVSCHFKLFHLFNSDD